MRKVNLTVIRPWIAKKVVELVGFEDEVVVEYAMGLLEDKQQPVCRFEPRVKPDDALMLVSEPRPQKNADQSDWISHKGYPFVYERAVGLVAGRAGLAWRYSSQSR